MAIASTILLVYASIVPLIYQPLSWEETWVRWQNIPWNHIGLYSRSDWIANGLVVMPLAFFWCGAIDYVSSSRWLVWIAAPLVVFFLSALVFGIEGLQVWFPPRTVSQNDIAAGCVGAVLGAIAWLSLGRRTIQAIESFSRIESVSGRVRWLVAAVAIGCLLYTVYPFDFVLSGEELKEKVRLGRLGWGIGWNSKQEFLQIAKGCVLASLKVAPFGIWLALTRKDRFPWLAIPLIALSMEAVQIPIYSKYATLIEGVFGVLGGWLAWVGTGIWLVSWERLRRGWIWSCAIALYAIALVVAFNWRFEEVLRDGDLINRRWHGAFSWPLVKYYYTSEYSAFSNLVGKLATFAFLGGLFGMQSWIVHGRTLRSVFWLGIVLTGALGVLIEGMQIFLPPIVPDINDVVVYVLGYAIGYGLVALVLGSQGSDGHLLEDELKEPSGIGNGDQTPVQFRSGVGTAVHKKQGRDVSSIVIESSERIHAAPVDRGLGVESWRGRSWKANCASGFAIAASLGVAILHPLWAPWMVLAGLILFGMVAMRPTLFAFLFPILVVGGDAYPLTGQLLIQEYDSLLLAGLAGVLWNLSRTKSEYRTLGEAAITSRWQRMGTVAFWIGGGCLLASVLLSGWRGWSVLLPTPFGDQLSVYFSQQNALRISKGYVWGMVYFGLERRWGDFSRGRWSLWFVRGLKASIVYVTLFVLVERLAYESLWDFQREYRATGPFFTMHIGDQHVDAFIALALPWAWSFSRGLNWRAIAISIALSVLMAMAAIYTMSRATLAAVILQILLLGVLFATQASWHRGVNPWFRRAMVVGAVVFAATIGVAVYQAESIRSRFVSTRGDMDSRWQHWRSLLETGEWAWSDRILGRGLGTLPTKLAQDKGLPVPPVRWLANGGQGEIHLQGGWPLYLEQYRWPVDRRLERIKILVRSQQDHLYSGELTLYRCRKSMLHSYEKTSVDVADAARKMAGNADWHEWGLETTLPSVASQLGDRNSEFWGAEASGISAAKDVSVAIVPWRANRGLFDGKEKEEVMFPQRGRGLLSGSAPWTFTCDDHMVWRAKNGAVHVLFEQGILGLLGWCGLLLSAVATAFQPEADRLRVFQRRLALISLFGFGVVCFFGTLVDTPWILALLLGVLSSIYAKDMDRNRSDGGDVG
jgi:VanZ family protein